MGIKVKWMRTAAHIAAIICVFFAGFLVARDTLQSDFELPANEPVPPTDLVTQIYEPPVNEPEPLTEPVVQVHESANELAPLAEAENIAQPHQASEMWNESLNDDLLIEFITLPTGTIVDTRVPEGVIELIIRYFEAIENGDLVGFRAMLMGQDMFETRQQTSLMICYFGDIVGIDHAMYGTAIADATDHLIHDQFFHGQFPLNPRNTGLFVQEIVMIDDWARALRVSVTYDEHEDSIHFIHLHHRNIGELGGAEWWVGTHEVYQGFREWW